MSHTHHGEDYRDIDGMCGVCGCTTITHGQARRIAAEWHGGQTSALCALATSGYVDKAALTHEIRRDLDADSPTSPTGQDRAELEALLVYIQDRRLEGPWAGNAGSDYDGTIDGAWSNLWDDTPVCLAIPTISR